MDLLEEEEESEKEDDTMEGKQVRDVEEVEKQLMAKKIVSNILIFIISIHCYRPK